jgi:hypothetical protein
MLYIQSQKPTYLMRKHWAHIVAQNEVQERRVLEESNIMIRKIEQEISDTDATIKDTSKYPLEAIDKLATKLGPEMQLNMLKKLIAI